MDVFLLKVSNPQPRGYTSQFLFEVQKGVFAGALNFRVASLLYAKLRTSPQVTSVIWLRSSRDERGFVMRTGDSDEPSPFPVLDFDSTDVVGDHELYLKPLIEALKSL